MCHVINGFLTDLNMPTHSNLTQNAQDDILSNDFENCTCTTPDTCPRGQLLKLGQNHSYDKSLRQQVTVFTVKPV